MREATDAARGAEKNAKPSKQLELDALLGSILLYGVVISLVLVTSSLIWKWFETGQFGFDYELAGMNLFQFATTEIRTAFAGQFRPHLLMNLGIAVLMMTPFMRVIASLVFFAAVAKNWKYVLFTSFVLVVLTYSLFLR
jgi:uncharacterized membrane protein